MNNLEEQAVSICECAPSTDDSPTVAAASPQLELPGATQELTLDCKLCATYRFAAEELRKALARIGVVKEVETELRFKDGVFSIQKHSGTLACQVEVRLHEHIGQPFGFRMDDEEFDDLADIEGDLRVQVFVLEVSAKSCSAAFVPTPPTCT